jgi:hypothetical protein
MDDGLPWLRPTPLKMAPFLAVPNMLTLILSEPFGMRAQDLKIRSNSKVIAFPPRLRCRRSESSLAANTTRPFFNPSTRSKACACCTDCPEFAPKSAQEKAA